jgi:LPS export ABC transporter protein LptC
MSGRISIILIIISLLSAACEKAQNPDEILTYSGPFVELDNVETLYSDSAVLRVKLKAAKQLELQNGDREFPQGLYIEFFDEKGKKSSTLTSNRGTYKKDDNLYIVRGNVMIQNLVEKKKLKTEELKWDPEKEKVKTDKFIRIEGPEEILTGTGLDANQDFSSYTIHKPEGIFPVEK